MDVLQSFCYTIIVSTLLVSAQDVPNPFTSPKDCGISKAGYICDPEGVITDTERDDINNGLVDFNSKSACGQCLAVLSMRKIQSGVSTAEAHKETKQFAKWVTGHSDEPGHWRFPKCKRLAVILLNRDQRYVWFQAGPNSGLCSEIGSIFNQNKTPFAKKKYADGITAMIESYTRQHKAVYRSSADCEMNTYPCKSKKHGRKPHYKSMNELLALLPNPATSPEACRISTSGFLCDPEQVLTQSERRELADGLKELISSNACGQCIAVAILNKARAKQSVLKRTFLKLQNRWDFPDCKGVLTIFISMANKFVWINGDDDTVQCSEITKLYNENKHYFASRKVYDGIIGIVGSYADTLSSSAACSDRTCSRSSSNRGNSGSGGGLGGIVLSKVKDVAVKNKGTIIGLIVGLLVLVGLGLCCGMCFCRQKTMKGLRGLGSLAASQGPKMASRFNDYNSRRTEKYEYRSGTAEYSVESRKDSIGGAGGTWGEPEDEGSGGEGGGGGGSWEEEVVTVEVEDNDDGGGGSF